MAVNAVSKMFFFFQAEVGIRVADVTGVQTCSLPIYRCGVRIDRARSLDTPSDSVVDAAAAIFELAPAAATVRDRRHGHVLADRTARRVLEKLGEAEQKKISRRS